MDLDENKEYNITVDVGNNKCRFYCGGITNNDDNYLTIHDRDGDIIIRKDAMRIIKVIGGK